jgi:hypothetical protein
MDSATMGDQEATDRGDGVGGDLNMDALDLDQLKAWFKGLSKDEKRIHGAEFNRRVEELQPRPKPAKTATDVYEDPERWLEENKDKVHFWWRHSEADGTTRYLIGEIVNVQTDENREALKEKASTTFGLSLINGLLVHQHRVRIPR